MLELPSFSALILSFIGLNTIIVALLGLGYLHARDRGTQLSYLSLRRYAINTCLLFVYGAVTVLGGSLLITMLGLDAGYFSIHVDAVSLNTLISSAASLYICYMVLNLASQHQPSAELS